MRLSSCFLVGGAVLGLVADVRDASACGGCFHPVAEVSASVVTDHRMVFKVSTNETILWDQVRYTGSPEEFAWVLPVREGARVELSRDAWISALDATTTTSVKGPERFCSGGGSSGGGGGGCGAVASVSESAPRSSSASADAGFASSGGVSVVSQSVIGPYQSVTLRASDKTGISAWLTNNGFAIPDSVKPTVDAYTSEGFDFIALRLRPGQGVQAMRPVRVVTQGADTTLPLRMVAAGVGAKVGLTLWIVGEGRYRLANFPNATVDDARLVWDHLSSRSNLTDLEAEIFASNGGRTWLTESAGHANVAPNAFSFNEPNLFLTYNSACITRPVETVPCSQDQLPPGDGAPSDVLDGGLDAGDGDAGVAEASPSADASTPKSCVKVVSGCDGFDDLDVAVRGLHSSDVWVTRVRADLPVGALDADLRLEAGEQVAVSATHSAERFKDPSYDPCSTATGSDDGSCACRTSAPIGGSLGTWLTILVTAALSARMARRRR